MFVCRCPRCPLRSICADFPRWGRDRQGIQLDEVEEVSLFFTLFPQMELLDEVWQIRSYLGKGLGEASVGEGLGV